MPNLSSSKRSLYLMLVIFALCLFGYAMVGRKVDASASGPTPGNTGAPGEPNCTACHTSFPVNSGGGSVVVSGLPAYYQPNQIIPITVTVNHVGAVIYGFQLTPVDDVGRPAGTLLTSSPELQILPGIVGPFTRDYIEHTILGVIPTQFNTKSWTFNWRAPASKVGRITLHAAGNGADSDGSNNGDYIYTTSSSTSSSTPPANFDGDTRSDISVYRPSNGNWYIIRSSNGAFSGQGFGTSTDKLVPGDFDGDGKHDLGVFRPSNGTWYILKSSDGTFRADAFGSNGDLPVVGDYDGDGKSDLAVFRPSTGTWYIIRSSNGALQVVAFGSSEDKAVSGDFDGDGKTDVAVYRPSSGTWYQLRSSDGGFVATQFGISSDKPVQGDYDGDGQTDVAVYRPASGTWYVLRSTAGFAAYAFGISTDKPAPGDFDGDGKTDVSVFRDGVWYISLSSNGSLRVEFFGAAGDIPVPAGYLPE